MNLGQIGCPKTSVRNYNATLHMAMQALVWLWFKAIWFGMVQLCASYANLS
jgi:hypothetical protein